MEWDGTRSDDGGGVGGVALGWVFAVEGGTRVRVHWDGRGVMRGGRNELGWVRIGESLTGCGYCWSQETPPSDYHQSLHGVGLPGTNTHPFP